MKTKTYLIAGLLSLACAVAAQAQTTLTDTWSTAAAWNSSDQPQFSVSSHGGGTLFSDNTISGSGGSGATWFVSGLTGYAGLYNDADDGYCLYTGASPSTSFSINSGIVLSDVSTITLTITAGGLADTGTFTADTVTLAFDSSTVSLASFSSVDSGTSQQGSEMYTFTYTWDVSGLTTGNDSFAATWSGTSEHTAFQEVALTQTSASAIPEPATYAAIFAGFALVLVLLRRRVSGAKRA